MSVLSDLRVVAVHRGFRRLLTVRLVSQTGDGAFQAGLATLFFFAPERMATAADVAAAFAVLLVPFTVVGPWAGVLLDRWRRRQVLLVGNALRVVLTGVLAVLMVSVGVGPLVYVLSLVTLGINRFLLSALSAGLPRVVPREQLLIANTISPTLGAAAAGVGAGAGFVAGLIASHGPTHDAIALVGAALLFGAASALALRLGPDDLGPTHRAAASELWHEVQHIARGLVDGARHLVERRTPAYALGVMAVHRFIYGAMLIASILLSRNVLSDPTDAAAGLATFGSVLAVSGVGFAVAVVLTPLATQRMSLQTWIVVCLVAGAAGQSLLLVDVSRLTVLASAGLLGLTAEGAKIAVDTIVQRDTDDDFRGRAFATYDMLYNAAFVGAAALGAVVLPNTGEAPAVFAGLALLYLATAAAFRLAFARTAATEAA
ncbi:MFS transporter [Isoptericola sp. b441]|uniref:MFS transporter n=1 Tax=Actinotalea lenta TaxID=3064654 RepID=A0ABT9D7J3_9CELL|nr:MULTISPECIES: MFS transporter [unclassified Isoptericola]MDO8106194.1 MFS transporter [Isoptericola sp. b441]MDO8122087.1 MFS transporter [Isoptericola sp. b490]